MRSLKVNVSVSCVISCTKSGGAHDFVMEAAEARDGDDDAAKTAQYATMMLLRQPNIVKPWWMPKNNLTN